MSAITIGLLSFPVLLTMIFLRVPIGLAMFLTGLGGMIMVTGDTLVPFARLKSETYGTFSNYSLSIVPMFLLMGHFATLGGMSQALFKAAEGWLGHRKGGVAMASIGACAGFGSICGSSLATAATLGRVALPELKRYGYAGGFSTATLAAGGTLGILIPPSVVLVIYAILTEQNISKLFLAAIIPGILAALGYMLAISIYVRLNPHAAGQTRPRVPYAARFKALVDVWPVLLVFPISRRWNLPRLVHTHRRRCCRRTGYCDNRMVSRWTHSRYLIRQLFCHRSLLRDDIFHCTGCGLLQRFSGTHSGTTRGRCVGW